MIVHLYSENRRFETACGKPTEGRGRVRNITGVEGSGSCRECLAARRQQREREQACLDAYAKRRSARADEEEAQIRCEACAPGHPLGALCKPCDVTGCECWCNR